MFLVDEEIGNITLTQGDSGEYTINGLPTDQYYDVYLAIQDKKRNPIGNEIKESANLKSSVSLKFLSYFLTILSISSFLSVLYAPGSSSLMGLTISHLLITATTGSSHPLFFS